MKGLAFCRRNGIQKARGLDLWAEPLRIELCRVPPPPLDDIFVRQGFEG